MGRRRSVLEGPALDLCVALRVGGHAELAAWLSEAVPQSAVISGDGHRPLLRERLGAVAGRTDVPGRLREQAERLAAVADDPVAAIGRIGTAWIAWHGSDDSPAAAPSDVGGWYVVSWQADDPEDQDLYEDGPDVTALEDALAWGRRRTDAVIVRPAWDEGRHYWAGAGNDTRGLPPLAEPPAS